MNNLTLVHKFRFPKKFAHLSSAELATLKTKVVGSHGGQLTEVVYANLADAAKAEDFTTLVGPFGDSIDGSLCIRFETSEACRLLSA